MKPPEASGCKLRQPFSHDDRLPRLLAWAFLYNLSAEEIQLARKAEKPPCNSTGAFARAGES